MLRDYYTYGFKDRANFAGSLGTYNNDKKRLNDFLGNYMEWAEQKIRKSATSVGKNVTFVTCDSQSMEINPFHRVYRFCGTDRPDYLYYFFHTIAALNSLFQLSEGTDTLELYEAAATRFESKLNIQEKHVIRTVKSMHVGRYIEEQLEGLYGDEEALIKKARELGLLDEQVNKLKQTIQESTIKLKTSELLRFYAQNVQDITKIDTESNNRTANNRLQRLSNMGIVCCDQNGGDHPFSDEQIALILEAISDEVKTLLDKENKTEVLKKSLKNYTTIKPGDRNWYLSGLTVKRLVDAGQTVDSQFDKHLSYALDFYSKTFLFGEIGTFILDRLRSIRDVCPIRIKHEYYMHSLNDFNAIDLMAAIEDRQWCLISYKRDDVETKLLCFPIELRISSTDGREYLMYYEPFKRSCASLRLEFVEAIQYYQDYHVKAVLSDYYHDTEIAAEVDRNLSRAKLLMDYTWGVSTGSVQEENVEKLNTIFRELRVRIAYNKDTDYYILNRLYRESRIGLISVNAEEGYIDFTVVAANINEIIPFIRSFYGRVISCIGFNGEKYSVEMDIEYIVGQVINKCIGGMIEDENPQKSIDNKFLKVLGEGVKANAHEKLFNEMFSAFYHIFAAIFSEICNGVHSYTEEEISSLCKDTMYRYRDECGSDMLWLSFGEGKVFADMLKKGGFLIEERDGSSLRYKPKYETNSFVDLYKDVIPLSELEIRWLKTIISDEKIHYFLNEKEIMAVKLLLAEKAIDIKPFPMNVVNYFDRYKFSPKKEWKEGTVLIPILDAIHKSHVVKINYISSKKNVVSGSYKPILVEYSKRDNCFKGYFLSSRKKEGLKVYNLAQFISVEDSGKQFDSSEVKTYFDVYREQQMDKLEIEFDDKSNIADRVLTEFSPWKKFCEFDVESGVYHLTVYYQKQDGKELALRLLGFGSDIRMLDQDHRLFIIIKSKLRDQMDRMQKQVIKPVRSGEKTDGAR